MAFPSLLQSTLRLTQAIFYGRSTTGAVPTTRNINTTAPLTGGGNLSADLTLGLTTSPAGQVPVGVTRLLTMTAPLKIGGGASADLSADRTLSVDTFGTGNSGVVPASGGGTTNFLCANGSWLPVAGGAGVPVTRLINTTAPLTGGGDLTADRTLGITIVTTIASGIVPATGGADPTKFLCATSPVSWTQPGTGSFIRLQNPLPGTADSGSGHINGTMWAETAMVVSPVTSAFDSQPSLNIISDSPTASFGTPSAMINAQIHFAAVAAGASMGVRRSRGDHTTPIGLNDFDDIGEYNFTGRASSQWSTWKSVIRAIADGIPSSTVQKTILDIISGGPTQATYIRSAKEGVRIGTVAALGTGGFASGSRPVHTLDLLGSLGLNVALKSAGAFTTTGTDCLFLVDCSAGGASTNLPTAVGIPGRLYGFMKTDTTISAVTVAPFAGQSINGSTNSLVLLMTGDFVLIVSDGSNWWIISSNLTTVGANSGDFTAVANTASETQLALIPSIFPQAGQTAGATYATNIMGKLSTTGTPTLRFKIKNFTGGDILADSGAVTMPNGVTNVVFQIDYESSDRTSGVSPTIRVSRGILSVSQTAGIGAAINNYNMVDIASVTSTTGYGSFPAVLTAQWGTANPSNTVTAIEVVARQNRAKVT